MVRLLKFTPAILAIPVALTIGVREGILLSSVTSYYPLMISMIFGSMIAGSTPLGGGVVAFPVTVLVLGFSPSQGRDFSLMIQSVGMSAASFLIFTEKGDLLKGCANLTAGFCFFSVLGMILGLHLELPPFAVNTFYTTSVACMAIFLASNSFHRVKKRNSSNKESSGRNSTEITSSEEGTETQTDEDCGSCEREKLGESNLRPRVNNVEIPRPQTQGVSNLNNPSTEDNGSVNIMYWFGVAVSALFGGFLSAQIGSGADIAWYAYGCFLNSSSSSRLFRSCTTSTSANRVNNAVISDNSLTAISIIVMACTSIYGTILRISDQTSEQMVVDEDVYHALLACSFIVVVGAPIGSLFLTPSYQNKLKILFYVFAIVQLVLFGVIKIQDNRTAWACVAGAILSVCVLSICHHQRCRKDDKKETLPENYDTA